MLRLLCAHALSRHVHLVRDAEGRADRVLRLGQYDQANVVYLPKQMSRDELRLGQIAAYDKFYAPSSLVRAFPISASAAGCNGASTTFS